MQLIPAKSPFCISKSFPGERAHNVQSINHHRPETPLSTMTSKQTQGRKGNTQEGVGNGSSSRPLSLRFSTSALHDLREKGVTCHSKVQDGNKVSTLMIFLLSQFPPELLKRRKCSKARKQMMLGNAKDPLSGLPRCTEGGRRIIPSTMLRASRETDWSYSHKERRKRRSTITSRRYRVSPLYRYARPRS